MLVTCQENDYRYIDYDYASSDKQNSMKFMAQ